MKKVYIAIIKRGDDCGRIIQWANTIEHAQKIIQQALPKLEPGYYYRIIEE